METLLTAIQISLITVAINATTWDNMIFGNPAKWLKSKIRPRWLLKPLFLCLICMASFWTLLYWVISGFCFNVIKVMLITAGLNTVVTALISNIIPDEENQNN